MNHATAYLHAMCVAAAAYYQRVLGAEHVHMRAGYRTMDRVICAGIVRMEGNKVIASLMLLAGHLGAPANEAPFDAPTGPEAA